MVPSMPGKVPCKRRSPGFQAIAAPRKPYVSYRHGRERQPLQYVISQAQLPQGGFGLEEVIYLLTTRSGQSAQPKAGAHQLPHADSIVHPRNESLHERPGHPNPLQGEGQL